jgi:hypothetical protein
LFDKLPVKSFSLKALLLERLRCGILGIDDVLDMSGSFSEVTEKGIIIDTFIFLNYCGNILSEKVLNKVYPNIASIYIFTTIQTFFLHLISLISQWLTHKKS